MVAFVAPMAVFLGLLALNSLAKSVGDGFWFRSAEYWIFPLQTIVCGALLWRFRRAYELGRPRRIGVACVVGVVVFAVWIAPQIVLHFPARTIGFDPTVFASQPALYYLTLGFRFARLVIVVPLMEEIFWRGFLLRYFIDERFDRVPIGTFSALSFAAVTVGFMLVHNVADWPAALICGALYNGVAYWTRSLASCVVAHALTNLLLGLWIMQSRQWGLW